MAKKKSIFFCEECGFETPHWLGKCPQCQEWNTLKEMSVSSFKKDSKATAKRTEVLKNIKPLSEVELTAQARISIGFSELNRVLGGGVVCHTTILFAGEPGIGKSTLLLQTCNFVAKSGVGNVLYVSAEESVEQIRERSIRLNVKGDNLFVIAQTNLDLIEDAIKKIQPSLVILDSIQAVSDPSLPSSPGTVTQVRDVSGKLGQMAKEDGFVLFLIGHVTKDGTLAGPRTLEHMVDVVVYFEGDRYQSLRIVRSIKNRYGSTGEVGIFEMKSDGLSEITNPSSVFLPDSDLTTPGRVTVAVIEGRRPFLVEVQSLTNKSSFNNPIRRALGVESNKLSLLIAVLERSLGFDFSASDVFVKAVGGLRLHEAACDLALAIAIISSYTAKTIPLEVVLIGELGLGGEIRKVQLLDARIKEAERLGFKKVIIPKNNSKITKLGKLEIVEVARLEDVFKLFFKEVGNEN